MYIPLKVTTDYSLLKSTIKIDNLMTFLGENKISACAICDEFLYGTMEFYDKCLKNNIKPIIGLDIIVNSYHLYLYAKNYQGYQNLLKLNTFKTERHLELEDLKKYDQDILLIIPFSSLSLYEEIRDIFEDSFIGYQNEKEKVEALLISSNIVYVNEIRALKKEDTKYLNYLEMIYRDEKVSTYEFQSFDANCYHLDVRQEDIESTKKVSDLLNVVIPKDISHMPKYSLEIDNSKEYLESLSKKGLKKRLEGNVTTKYLERLNYELEVINKMGFADYILIVYDYVLYAKKNNIFVGPGRGSAAGSLVCYTLGITDIDPLKYNLLFERFLNPERVTMPDIDIDFENTKRQMVISYIKERYGYDKVASIMTFATLKSKLVLREVARVIQKEEIIESLLKKINANLSLKENLDQESVKSIIGKNQEFQNIYKIALKLEGLKKNISTHAAGVVISKTVLDEVIPIRKNNDNISTGITMEYLEELGLLKMDLLAIKNLTIIANILDLIYKDTGRHLNLAHINLNDGKVLEIFARGDTTGIFQFESGGMRSFLEKLKPTSFNDIVASIALYRPGPMDNIDLFIKRKEGREIINYIIPELEFILKETEGIIVYQEQVMQILVLVANYSFAEADLVRRAMSKKKKDILLKEEANFIKRATNNGYGKHAKELYDLILKFANYGFNKSHSVAYALVGYQMAYLKVKFPKYFITNLLNMSIGSEIKTSEYLLEAKKLNLKIVKPSVNISYDSYYLKNEEIILSFSIIKGISNITIKSIIEEREENGLFKDFISFVKRMYNKNINERILENLINAGIFRDFGGIAQLKANLAIVLNYAEIASSVDESLISEPKMKEVEEIIDENKLEYNSYGFYISNHPASKYQDKNLVKIFNIASFFDKYIKCVVLIENIRRIKTKNQEEMAFIEASDETGIGNFVVFAKQIRLLDDLKVKDIAEFQGRVTKRYDKYQVNVNNIIKR